MNRIVVLAVLGIWIAALAAFGEDLRSTEPKDILGKTWQWEQTTTPDKKLIVPNPVRYTILLTKDGKLQARFDCNRGGGDYRISNGILSFGPLSSTRVACPPDSLDATYMKDLQQVNSFYVQDNTLYLGFPLDGGTMQFRKAP